MSVHSSSNPFVHLPMRDKQGATCSAKGQDGPLLVPDPGRTQWSKGLDSYMSKKPGFVRLHCPRPFSGGAADAGAGCLFPSEISEHTRKALYRTVLQSGS